MCTEWCFYNALWHLPMAVKYITVRLSRPHSQQSSETLQPVDVRQWVYYSGWNHTLSQQCPVHLNTIIHLVMCCLCASKWPYSSCRRQALCSASIYQVKRGPITSPQCECDQTADEPLPGEVTVCSALDGDDMPKPQSLIFFFKGNGEDYLRINSHMSACQ